MLSLQVLSREGDEATREDPDEKYLQCVHLLMYEGFFHFHGNVVFE